MKKNEEEKSRMDKTTSIIVSGAQDQQLEGGGPVRHSEKGDPDRGLMPIRDWPLEWRALDSL